MALDECRRLDAGVAVDLGTGSGALALVPGRRASRARGVGHRRVRRRAGGGAGQPGRPRPGGDAGAAGRAGLVRRRCPPTWPGGSTSSWPTRPYVSEAEMAELPAEVRELGAPPGPVLGPERARGRRAHRRRGARVAGATRCAARRAGAAPGGGRPGAGASGRVHVRHRLARPGRSRPDRPGPAVTGPGDRDRRGPRGRHAAPDAAVVARAATPSGPARSWSCPPTPCTGWPRCRRSTGPPTGSSR